MGQRVESGTASGCRLRAELRAEVAAAHAALEAELPIAAAAPDEAAYRDHLGFLLPFVSAAEDSLEAVTGLASLLPDWRERRKAALLRLDLGLAEPAAARCDAFAPRCAGEALGLLYVLEGSGLGARVLLARLRSHGVVPGPIGTRYLEAYGPRAPAMWRRFCDRLDAPRALARRDAVRRGARKTFEALLGWRRRWTATSSIPRRSRPPWSQRRSI